MSKRLKILTGVVVAIIFIAFVFIIGSQQKTPTQLPIKITGSIPTDNATEVSVFNPIVVTFNQIISPTSVSVSSDPTEIWTISQTNPTVLNINHTQYLRNGTDYKLFISIDGKTIQTIHFKTETSQNDPRQIQQLQSEIDKKYPLRVFLPYETADFRVIYSSPLTFEIELKTNISTQNAINQVQSWVKSKDMDPSTHTYNVIPK